MSGPLLHHSEVSLGIFFFNQKIMFFDFRRVFLDEYVSRWPETAGGWVLKCPEQEYWALEWSFDHFYFSFGRVFDQWVCSPNNPRQSTWNTKFHTCATMPVENRHVETYSCLVSALGENRNVLNFAAPQKVAFSASLRLFSKSFFFGFPSRSCAAWTSNQK